MVVYNYTKRKGLLLMDFKSDSRTGYIYQSHTVLTDYLAEISNYDFMDIVQTVLQGTNGTEFYINPFNKMITEFNKYHPAHTVNMVTGAIAVSAEAARRWYNMMLREEDE